MYHLRQRKEMRKTAQKAISYILAVMMVVSILPFDMLQTTNVVMAQELSETNVDEIEDLEETPLFNEDNSLGEDAKVISGSEDPDNNIAVSDETSEGNVTISGTTWTIQSTLVMCGNGGTFSSGQKKISRNFTGTATTGGINTVQITISSDRPSRTGYTFMGWDGWYPNDMTDVLIDHNLKTTNILNAGSVFYAGNSTTYYVVAVWKIITYDVNYNYNNGEQSLTESKKYNVKYTISSKIPTRTGYDFLGWDTSSNASNVVWKPGEAYTENKALNLYAVWKPHTYKINYHGNGGNNAPENQIKTHDDNMKVPSITPSRAGYTFLGWAEDKDAVLPEYRPGDTLPEKSMDLYAIWRIVLPSGSVTVIGTSESEGDQTIFEDIFIATGDKIKAFDIVIEYPDFLRYNEYIKLNGGLEHDVYAAERKEGTKRVLELSLNSNTGISIDGTIPLGRILFTVEDSENYAYGSYNIVVRQAESYFIYENSSQVFLDYAGKQKFEYLPYKARKIEITGESSISEASAYSIKFTPEKTTDKSVSWSVDNSDIAEIDENGILTPHKNGTVTITARTLDGSNLSTEFLVEVVSQKAKIRNIKVPEAVWKQKFSPDTYRYTLYVPEYCDTITLTAEFDAGSLLCEGYGYLTSGIARKFAVESEMISFVLKKSETGYTDNSYTISVLKDKSAGGITENGLVYKVDGSDKAIITGYSGKEKVVVIPSEIDGKNVYKIEDNAFASCGSLESVIIAPCKENITIGENAFPYTVKIYNLSNNQISGITTEEYSIIVVKNGISTEGQKVLPADLAEIAGYKDSEYDAAYYYTDTKESSENTWYLRNGREIDASVFEEIKNSAEASKEFCYVKNIFSDDILIFIKESGADQNRVTLKIYDVAKLLSDNYHYTYEIKEIGEKDGISFVTVEIKGIISNGYYGIKTVTKNWDEIKENKFTVVFDTMGHGDAIKPITGVEQGSLIKEPDALKEEGFRFTGWYKDEACTIKWIFTEDTVENDIILYAGWVANPIDTPEEGLHVTFINGTHYNYTGSMLTPAVRVTNTVNGTTHTLIEGVDYTVKYSNNIKATAGDTEADRDNADDKKKARVTVIGKGNLSGRKDGYFVIDPVDISEAAKAVEAGNLIVAENSKAVPILVYGSYKLGNKDYEIVTGEGFDKDKNHRWVKEESGSVIRVKGKGNFAGVRDIAVTVKSKNELKNFKVDVQTPKMDYTGAPLYPEIVVYDKKDRSKTPLSRDNYMVVWPDEDTCTNAGKVSFSVIGMNDYCGSVTAKYTINPDKNGSNIKIEASIDEAGYPFVSTGVTIDNAFTLTYAVKSADGQLIKNKPMVIGKDYKITYSNNKNVGEARYRISFIGSYRGTKSVGDGDITGKFKIIKCRLDNSSIKNNVIQAVSADMVYKKPGVYKSVPVITVNGTLVKASEYAVTYHHGELNADGTVKTIGDQVDTRTAPLTFDGVDDNVLYIPVIVKIVAKGNSGKGNYVSSAATENGEDAYLTTTFKVWRPEKESQYDLTKARVTIVEGEGKTKLRNVEYTGKETYPNVKVEVKNGRSFVDVDTLFGSNEEKERFYDSIIYVNNINKGKATIVINGDGNKFIGSKKVTYNIAACNLKNLKNFFINLNI